MQTDLIRSMCPTKFSIPNFRTEYSRTNLHFSKSFAKWGRIVTCLDAEATPASYQKVIKLCFDNKGKYYDDNGLVVEIKPIDTVSDAWFRDARLVEGTIKKLNYLPEVIAILTKTEELFNDSNCVDFWSSAWSFRIENNYVHLRAIITTYDEQTWSVDLSVPTDGNASLNTIPYQVFGTKNTFEEEQQLELVDSSYISRTVEIEAIDTMLQTPRTMFALAKYILFHAKEDLATLQLEKEKITVWKLACSRKNRIRHAMIGELEKTILLHLDALVAKLREYSK